MQELNHRLEQLEWGFRGQVKGNSSKGLFATSPTTAASQRSLSRFLTSNNQAGDDSLRSRSDFYSYDPELDPTTSQGGGRGGAGGGDREDGRSRGESNDSDYSNYSKGSNRSRGDRSQRGRNRDEDSASKGRPRTPKGVAKRGGVAPRLDFEEQLLKEKASEKRHFPWLSNDDSF